MSPKLLPRDLWFARAYYFACLGGWGFIPPFIDFSKSRNAPVQQICDLLTLFYISLGLSGTRIGTIGSVSSIVGLIASPIMGSVIKKRPQARGILQASLTLGAIAYFLLGLQTTFLTILLVVFLQALVISSIMPASDAMAVHVAQEAAGGYGVGLLSLWLTRPLPEREMLKPLLEQVQS